MNVYNKLIAQAVKNRTDPKHDYNMVDIAAELIYCTCIAEDQKIMTCITSVSTE